VLAERQGSQDCIKHTIKIHRNCFSKKSQHNPGSTLVSSAPNLWAVESRARLCAWLPESSHLQANQATFTLTHLRMCANVVV